VRTARTLECVAAERSVEQRTEQRTEQRERIEQREQQQSRHSVSPRTPGGGAPCAGLCHMRSSTWSVFIFLGVYSPTITFKAVKQEPSPYFKQEVAPDAMKGMAGIEAPSTGAGGSAARRPRSTRRRTMRA
jgi:hypothetical protein